MRNSVLPSRIRGDFAEFYQIGRNFPESRPFTAEPAWWGAREPPGFPMISRRRFYAIGHRIMVCGLPSFRPKKEEVALSFAPPGGISLNRAPSMQNRPIGGAANHRNPQDSMEIFLRNRPRINGARSPPSREN